MGWSAHVILEVHGNAIDVEVFRAKFKEFWIAYAELCSKTAVSQYSFPGSLRLPLTETLTTMQGQEDQIASIYADLVAKERSSRPKNWKSLAHIAFDAILRSLLDPMVPKDIKEHMWEQIMPEQRQKFLVEAITESQLDRLLHESLILDPFWRQRRSELLQIYLDAGIECHLVYDGTLIKWDLIDELETYAKMFPLLKFTLHLDREIAFKGVLI
eukprot:TRINITY_DN11856_c0_g1_i1.p1 TRINITY_DN11856_c0_g1~~TRINITY_DN11856_c0_g1_i1.p1  ORF type:complete len:214 (+),score=19.31 TRINITY_DN11856_c0_g1_i1:65-706(+)